MVDMRQWYVVYSKPHKENLAQFHLERKGLEVFFPQLLLPSLLAGRRRIVPLFPNYLFVRLSLPDEHYHVVWSPGVKRVVSFNGDPAPVDEEAVDFIRGRANPQGLLTARCSLATGQEVRFRRGPFDGLGGIIEDPPDARGRIKVLMRLLNRQVRVEVPVHFVDSSWAVAGGWGAGK